MVQRFVTELFDHDGVAQEFAPDALSHAFAHAVVAVALYLAPVADVVYPAGHARHLVDALDFSLYAPIAHATDAVAAVPETNLPSSAGVHDVPVKLSDA